MLEEEIRKALLVQARRLQGGNLLANEERELIVADREQELLRELEQYQERQRLYNAGELD